LEKLREELLFGCNMAHIKFRNVTLQYKIYGPEAKSLKHNLLSIGTGGRLFRDIKNTVSITALNNISFEFSDGDAVGLIGSNGAGKTTLLRTIAGIYTPIAGLIEISGKIATIFDLGAALDSELTGYENIYRMGMLLEIKKNEIDLLLPSIEEFTELGDFLDVPVRTYSSGMLMRLMFAVNTAKMPEILLVDETFGTGDKFFQEKAHNRMKHIVSGAKIFVFASHSNALIENYCNRVFELSHGELREIF
jgi:ABC-type polysaccharide/polyol phosphate transport system ATPase subunit